MGKYIDKKTMVVGSGCGIGVVQVLVTKQYDGIVPFIGPYLPVGWGTYSTLGNILIGGVAFGVSTFTKLIKSSDTKTFLQTYGITALIGGITCGIIYTMIPAGAGARVARGRGLALRRPVGQMQPLSLTGIPPTRVLA